MCGQRAQTVNSETHCPRNTPGFARSSVGIRGSKREAAHSNFEFIVLPEPQLCAGGESRQSAIIAALVNGKTMSYESRAQPVLNAKRSSRMLSKASRVSPKFSFVEVTKHVSGNWIMSPSSQRNDGGDGSRLSYPWHSSVDTRQNGPCRLKESISKTSTTVNRSPSMMVKSHMNYLKASAAKSAMTVDNSNHCHYLRTILLILDDKSIKFKNSSEPLQAEISTVLSSLVVTYEMEKPKPWPHVRNVAQQTHFHCEAANKDVLHPLGAYEFAKTRGYDFVRLKSYRLKSRRRSRNRHHRNKSLRIKYDGRFKSFADKKEVTVSDGKYVLQTTKCQMQHRKGQEIPYGVQRPHILDNELLESTRKDNERLGKVNIKLRNLSVAVSGGNTSESTKSTEDDAEVKERCNKGLGSTASYNESTRVSRKGYIAISQERSGSNGFSKSGNGGRKNSEKACDSTAKCLGSKESDNLTISSYLPRLFAKTSRQYKWYNSLSATISRETQLARKNHADEITERNSSKLKHSRLCCEIQCGGVTVNHFMANKTPQSSEYNFKGCIDDVQLEEISPLTNHISVSSSMDHPCSETEDVVCIERPSTFDHSLVFGNSNNNALPELQLSLDDLRNDFSYSEDEGDTSWEPRRPREPSRSSCQVNEDTFTSSNHNTSNRGILRLPLLMNNSSRRLTTSKKPAESASPIPPIASQKSVEEQSAKKRVKQSRRVKKDAGQTQYHFDLHKERLPGDMKSVRSKRRPTRLSPVVLKQPSNLSHIMNAQGEPLNEESNHSNAEKRVSSNVVLSTPKTSGLLSPSLVEDRNALDLPQSTCQHAFGDSAVSPVKPKQSTFLRSPDFKGFGTKPEHIVAATLAKETRFLPNLKHSENVQSNTKSSRGCNSNSSPPSNNNNSHSLNTNNSSTRSRTFGSRAKNKIKASSITSGRRTLNHNCNAVPVKSSGKNTRKRVNLNRKLCQYQDKFIDELDSELQNLIESHPRYQKSQASDINTSNTTRRLGHYREPAFENNGRSIRFGNMRQTGATGHVRSGFSLRAAVPFDFSDRNADRDSGLWSTNNEKSSVQNQSEVSGNGQISFQKNSENEIFHNSTYSSYAHLPNTEKHDRQVNYFASHISEENSSDSNNGVFKYNNDQNSSPFTRYFHQGGAEESMEVEETATEGGHYEMNLLAICRQLEERLQFSQGALPQALESLLLSFGRKLESLLRSVKENVTHTASNNVVVQEENSSSSHQSNNETVSRQSEPETEVSADSHMSPIMEPKSNSVKGILKTTETTNKSVQTAAKRKRVVILSETSLKCASTSSKSSKKSDSRRNKRRFRSTSSSRSSKTSSKKHRRPRGGSQVHKGARHWTDEMYTPLNTHPRSKGRRTGTSYHSYQHSRACRRRHATEGICCNVCLERAVASLKESQFAHAQRKNSARRDEKKAKGVKQKKGGLAKAYSRKSRDVSHKSRNTGRKPIVRKSLRNRNRSSNSSNGCNVAEHQRATINQNRNQNSRPRKSKKKSTGGKITRRRKITRPKVSFSRKRKIARPKVSYVITPKGQKTMYANLQKRYQHLVQMVENLNGSAKVPANVKNSDEYVQNLAMRFRNLVTNFPKDKLKTLEIIFRRYQEASERYKEKDPNVSSSSSLNSLDYEQRSKDKSSAPRPLKRKRPMEEPHASNASENIYSKTRRKQSHDSQNVADKLAEWSSKKAKPAKAVDSLILNRRRLVGLKNKSRNACMPTVNIAHRTRVFHEPAQKESFDFSHKSDSYISAEYSVSNSSLISSCSSCQNMLNACFFPPLYLLQGGYTPCISGAQTFNFGTATREAQPENLFMQKSNAYCTPQGPFLNGFLSNAKNPNCTTNVPTNTLMKDGQDQSLCNYFFLGTQPNQQGTPKTILPNALLSNDLQHQSKQRMLANTPFKQHCTDQTNNDKTSGQLCSNRMQQGVSMQVPNSQKNVISKNDEDSITQSCLSKTLLKPPNALYLNKSRLTSVSNLNSSLGVLDNARKGNETIREQLVNPASIFKFSSPLWGGLEPQFDRSLFEKSHVSDSKEKLDVSLPSNNTGSKSEGLANNNTDSEPSSKDSPIQNQSSVLTQASVTKSAQNSPVFVIRHVDEQNTQEVCLSENSPSTSLTAQSNSQDKTNNSMECLLDSKGSKKEIKKSHEPQSEPFWEKVQPDLIVHSPGISTTWKCYYDLPRNIRVATNATKVSNTLSGNRAFAGATTTTKQTNDCASHNLTAKETNASTECSSADEGITKSHRSGSIEGASDKEHPTSTDSASESSIDENANDNARNVGMSWSANTIQEFGNLVGKTKSLRIDDFMNTSTAPVNPWVANGHCVGSMVFFPGTACICQVDPSFSCAHVKAIDTRETKEKYHILRNGTLAQKCFDGPSTSKMEIYRYFSPLSTTKSEGHFSDKSALCLNKGMSPETWNYWREVFLQEAKISKKNDISIRKRHAKAPLSDFLVPPCKIPKLDIQSCLDQMLYRHRVSKRLRRSRFQLIRELRYLNKWQEAMEKLRRNEESNRVQSLITIDRSTHYDPSSDADSESSL